MEWRWNEVNAPLHDPSGLRCTHVHWAAAHFAGHAAGMALSRLALPTEDFTARALE
jgi:hypothetical protein